MSRVDAIPIALEIRELISKPQPIIEANTYRTREIMSLSVNGQLGTWHSLKGGIKQGLGKRGTYEVLYNPSESSWLKMVPLNEQSKENLTNRLRRSVEIQKAAFQVAGMSEYSQQVEECQITSGEVSTYGFKMRHIGPSVEYILERLKHEDPSVIEKGKKFLSEVYHVAFIHAAILYKKYGYWAEDPNPGNVIIHESQEGMQVALIDFSNKTTMRDNGSKARPTGINPKDTLQHGLNDLYRLFEAQCKLHGIPFSPNLQTAMDDLSKE